MPYNAREELKTARAELIRLIRRREEIETAIAKQKRKVAAWAELCDESEFADRALDLDLGGLTDACRTVLRGAEKTWMSISDIMEDLKELGFPLNTYKAAAASVTTTVNRLVDSGEVEPHKIFGGVTEYRWVGAKSIGQMLAGGTGVIDRNVIRRGLEIENERRKKKGE